MDPSYTLGDLAAKLATDPGEAPGRPGSMSATSDFQHRSNSSGSPSSAPRPRRGSATSGGNPTGSRRAGFATSTSSERPSRGSKPRPRSRTAVLQALTAHQQKPFDALVVIRGGGSVTDLAWLNDLELAKLLCQSPVPVFTGIGHERDNTILDEIAHTRFDTPSKVALHISTTIKDNALAAIQAWERINALVGRIVLRERTMLETQADRIETGVRSVLQAG